MLPRLVCLSAFALRCNAKALFEPAIRSGLIFIERPPGVPFQKIQFGNERGGRSVLSRLPELRIARILALLRCLILCLSV